MDVIRERMDTQKNLINCSAIEFLSNALLKSYQIKILQQLQRKSLKIKITIPHVPLSEALEQLTQNSESSIDFIYEKIDRLLLEMISNGADTSEQGGESNSPEFPDWLTDDITEGARARKVRVCEYQNRNHEPEDRL